MNQMTREILAELLLIEKAWDKKTRQLNYHWVIDNYRGTRAYKFDSEVLYPRLLRAHRMLAVWHDIPLTEDGWIDDYDLSDALSDQLCGDSMYNVVGYPIVPGLRHNQYFRDSYFSKIWESEEWVMENPTEQEILAIGIQPTLVPAKVGQPSLF